MIFYSDYKGKNLTCDSAYFKIDSNRYYNKKSSDKIVQKLFNFSLCILLFKKINNYSLFS